MKKNVRSDIKRNKGSSRPIFVLNFYTTESIGDEKKWFFTASDGWGGIMTSDEKKIGDFYSMILWG